MRARFRYLYLKYVLPAGPIYTSFLTQNSDLSVRRQVLLLLADHDVLQLRENLASTLSLVHGRLKLGALPQLGKSTLLTGYSHLQFLATQYQKLGGIVLEARNYNLDFINRTALAPNIIVMISGT